MQELREPRSRHPRKSFSPQVLSAVLRSSSTRELVIPASLARLAWSPRSTSQASGRTCQTIHLRALAGLLTRMQLAILPSNSTCTLAYNGRIYFYTLCADSGTIPAMKRLHKRSGKRPGLGRRYCLVGPGRLSFTASRRTRLSGRNTPTRLLDPMLRTLN